MRRPSLLPILCFFALLLLGCSGQPMTFGEYILKFIGGICIIVVGAVILVGVALVLKIR